MTKLSCTGLLEFRAKVRKKSALEFNSVTSVRRRIKHHRELLRIFRNFDMYGDMKKVDLNTLSASSGVSASNVE